MKRTMTIRGIRALVLALMATAFMTAAVCRGNRATSQVTDLSGVEQLKQKIQLDSGKVKLIALLSPV